MMGDIQLGQLAYSSLASVLARHLITTFALNTWVRVATKTLYSKKTPLKFTLESESESLDLHPCRVWRVRNQGIL